MTSGYTFCRILTNRNFGYPIDDHCKGITLHDALAAPNDGCTLTGAAYNKHHIMLVAFEDKKAAFGPDVANGSEHCRATDLIETIGGIHQCDTFARFNQLWVRWIRWIRWEEGRGCCFIRL